MPSASSTSSMHILTPMESNDISKNVLQALEKKVRNLEKRKGKLDSYKKFVDDGKELNEDQKAAVKNLDAVEQNLEFARDLQKHLVQLITEHQKQQKKQAKRDQVAQQVAQRLELVKNVQEILALQALMDDLSDDVRADFLNGANGAVSLTKENFTEIDDFYKLITPNSESDVPLAEQQSAASEHLVCYLESSSEEVAGSSYKGLRELVDKIRKCGYFDESAGTADAEVEEEGEEEAATEDDVVETAENAEDTSSKLVQDNMTDASDPGVGETDIAPEPVADAVADDDETGNVTAFTENEHGLNFLGESEVEVKAPQVPETEPSQSVPATEGTGSWGDEENDVPLDRAHGEAGGFETVQPSSNGFSSQGRSRGGFRDKRGGGDRGGFNRRGGDRGGDRGRQGRGGSGFRGQRSGGFGRQQDYYNPRGSGPRGGRGGGPRGPPRDGRRGGYNNQQQ